MKTPNALILVAAGGFTVTSCGSAKVGVIRFGRPTTTTLASVKTGTLIRCRGTVAAKAPPPGRAVTTFADNPAAFGPGTLRLKHHQDGSLVVYCEH